MVTKLTVQPSLAKFQRLPPHAADPSKRTDGLSWYLFVDRTASNRIATLTLEYAHVRPPNAAKIWFWFDFGQVWGQLYPGRPLSRPPQASVWGDDVQDQPRSACLVRMIWVEDQHAQHCPWNLSCWRQGGGPPCILRIKVHGQC